MFLRKIYALFHINMAGATSSTRLVCISDTHSNNNINLPAGDILIHAGDLTRRGSSSELKEVLSWLKSLTKFRLKILIGGNHDVILHETYYQINWHRFHSKKEDAEQMIQMFKDPKLREKYGIIYLEDQMFVDPESQLKFYGRFV